MSATLAPVPGAATHASIAKVRPVVLLTRATAREWATLWPLWNAFAGDIWSEERARARYLRESAAPGYVTYLAWADGQPVGYARAGIVARDERWAWLDHLFVLAPWRGAGIGRSLFTAVADWARTAGCPSLLWTADPGSERFYAALGAQRRPDLAEPRCHELLLDDSATSLALPYRTELRPAP